MATSASDADRQINNLMEFIFLEAQEKAEEIRQKANAEYESQFQGMKRDVEYVPNHPSAPLAHVKDLVI